MNETPRTPLKRRLLWFAALWAGGVAVLGLVALLVKAALPM
ncbi:MAG: DUF2474 family protein [Nitratireductor sp.]|nr:DUF2474 family protein [Nitratireductor sp.]